MLAPEKESIAIGDVPARKNSKPETRHRRASSVSGVGPLNIILRANEPPSAESFTKIKLLGKGDVGRVYLVEEKATGNVFAMKVLNKKEMIERNRVKRVLTEREILATANHPFIVACYRSFMDTESIYFVLDFCAGGEFFRMLQKQPNKCISEDAARFYAAEVLLALEYLHFLGFIYRDLKPENILLDEFGHVKLTDFDLSKASASSVQSAVVKKYGKSTMVSKPEVVTNSFVGTDEYVAPEVIDGYGHTSSVDWWTLGILIYEMLFGKTPFKGKDTEDTWRNITRCNLQFPDSPAVSADAKNLIKKLLHHDAKKRLGAEHGALDIKENKWFKSVSFDMILNKKPPIIPQLKSRTDTSYFRVVAENPPTVAATAPANDDDDRKPLTDKEKERAENALTVAFGVLGSPRAPRPPRYEAASKTTSATPSAATTASASTALPSAGIITSPRGTYSAPIADMSLALATVAVSSKPTASASAPSADLVKSPRATIAYGSSPTSTFALEVTSPRSNNKKDKEKDNKEKEKEKEREKEPKSPRRTSASKDKDDKVSRVSADKSSRISTSANDKDKTVSASRTSLSHEKTATVVPKLSRSLSAKIRDALVSPRSREKADEKEKEKEKEKPLSPTEKSPARKSSMGAVSAIHIEKDKDKDKDKEKEKEKSLSPAEKSLARKPSAGALSTIQIDKDKEKDKEKEKAKEKEKVAAATAVTSSPVRKTSSGAQSAIQHPDAAVSSTQSTSTVPHRRRSASLTSASDKIDKKEKKEKKEKKDTKEKK